LFSVVNGNIHHPNFLCFLLIRPPGEQDDSSGADLLSCLEDYKNGYYFFCAIPIEKIEQIDGTSQFNKTEAINKSLLLALDITFPAMARKGGRYIICPSTSSDEQSHPILAATVNSVSMSAGRSTISSGLQLHLLELENVHYEGGVPWMLIPDDKGVLHIAILTEISTPVTRDVAADIKLNLYTKYVIFFFPGPEK
jgi:hypothetical protein